MRVLITSIVDLERTGHNRLHQFIKGLSASHEVVVLSINDLWKESLVDVEQYRRGIGDTIKGVRITHFTERKLNPVLQEVFSPLNLGRLFRGMGFLRFSVHLNYSTLMSGYWVARRVRQEGINTVYDIADDLPYMIGISPQVPWGLRTLGRLAGQTLLTMNVRIASKVTFASASLPRYYGFPIHKAEHIPNGVDVELFVDNASPGFRRGLGLEGDFVLGYTGTLREWVDFEPVFQAMAELKETLPQLKLLVVGGEGEPEKLKRRVDDYGIGDRVRFEGVVPYTQVPVYLSCIDVCLIPRKPNRVSENMLPLKLLEYMACQKPVISPPMAGTVEAVQDRILYASNAAEYVAHILRLYQDRELRHRLGVAGREFVTRHYTWSAAVAKLEEVLKKAAAEGQVAVGTRRGTG